MIAPARKKPKRKKVRQSKRLPKIAHPTFTAREKEVIWGSVKNLDEELDRRYGPIWGFIQWLTRWMTLNRCALDAWHNADEVHHLYYCRWNRFWWFPPLPGIQVAGLCKGCHIKAHYKRNYILDPIDPVWKSCNTEAFKREVREGFWLICGSTWGSIIGTFLAIAFWLWNRFSPHLIWLWQQVS